VSSFGYCLRLFTLPVLGTQFPLKLFLAIHRFLFIFFKEKQKISANKCLIKQGFPTESFENILLDGYFQNAQLFETYRNDLIKCFKIKERYEKIFDKKYGYLFEIRTLVINYRLKEY